MTTLHRRQFLRHLGVSAATLPFLGGLPSLTGALLPQKRQRVIIMFSPNGTLPNEFWPDAAGDDLQFKSILQPLEPFKKQTLLLNGVCNKIRGDGDSHMRGMSCLLTASELLPGNIRGGGGNPAGWAGHISIDQEIKNFLQTQKETRTRFGSLEFGVAVPDRADPWTRMSYAGANQPIAPIDDPNQMFGKLSGKMKDRALSGVVGKMKPQDAKKLTEALAHRFAAAQTLAQNATAQADAAASATKLADDGSKASAKPKPTKASVKKPAPRKKAPAEQTAANDAAAKPAADKPAPAPAAAPPPAKAG